MPPLPNGCKLSIGKRLRLETHLISTPIPTCRLQMVVCAVVDHTLQYCVAYRMLERVWKTLIIERQARDREQEQQLQRSRQVQEVEEEDEQMESGDESEEMAPTGGTFIPEVLFKHMTERTRQSTLEYLREHPEDQAIPAALQAIRAGASPPPTASAARAALGDTYLEIVAF